MQWLYLSGLVVSLAGLAALDWRYRLAIWHDARRSLIAIAIGLMFFLAWDIAGIALGIFFHGDGPYGLPVRLAPELPLEEIVFLALLCYLPLLIYRWRTR